MVDTKISALPAVSSALAAQELPVNDAGTSRKLTVAQVADYLVTRINGNSGAAGEYLTLQHLASNAAANSTTTFATVMTTTGVGVGTWRFDYYIICQAAAITTGLKFQVGHSGTTGDWATHEWFPNDAATASTAVMASTSTAAVGVTGTNYVVTSSNGALGIPTGTVGTGDMFVSIRGLVEVTVTGSLTLGHASEVAASSTVMARTHLVLTKIA